MLSIETLQEVAPSVFATSPSPKMSDKYTFVPTIEVIENFDREGWKVYSQVYTVWYVLTDLPYLPQFPIQLP